MVSDVVHLGDVGHLSRVHLNCHSGFVSLRANRSYDSAKLNTGIYLRIQRLSHKYKNQHCCHTERSEVSININDLQGRGFFTSFRMTTYGTAPIIQWMYLCYFIFFIYIRLILTAFSPFTPTNPLTIKLESG